MSENHRKYPFESMPVVVQSALRAFVESLKSAVGSRLESLIVHGSAVRGGYREKASDIDALVILSDTSLETLEALANPLALARNAYRIDSMILKPSEIADAADAFPIFYSDIQQCHVVATGSDPFDTLVIPPEHIRLRIEQELREAKIRLRRAVTDSFGMPDALAGALHRKVRQVRGPLRALLHLKKKPCGEQIGDVLSACASEYHLDLAPLESIQRDPRAAHGAFRQLLDGAIADADRLAI
jgi:predicted nucleotidyltransferase